jgi:hypothetical protein
MLVIACGGDSTVAPESAVGSYTLQTVNGNRLPAVFYQDTQEKDEFVNGSVALSADNSWTGKLTLRGTDLTTNEEFSFTAPVGGTYSLNTGSITLTDAYNGLTFQGTVSGGTLSIGSEIVIGGTTSFMFQR